MAGVSFLMLSFHTDCFCSRANCIAHFNEYVVSGVTVGYSGFCIYAYSMQAVQGIIKRVGYSGAVLHVSCSVIVHVFTTLNDFIFYLDFSF